MESNAENRAAGGYSLPGGEISTPPDSGTGPGTPLSWRDAAGPAAAVVLAILFWQCFALEYIDYPSDGPGVGVPVFMAAFFAAVLMITGRPPSRSGIALAAAAMLLAVSCALHASPGITVLNCFVILALAALAAFALSGQNARDPFSLAAVPEAIRLSVLALFTRIDRPFRAAARAGKNDKRALMCGLGAALVTLVLLGVVLALLASADSVFGSFFSGVRKWFEQLTWVHLLWRIVRTVLLALLFASGLCFLREPAPAVRTGTKQAPERRAVSFLLPVVALDVVYIIFCFVQIRYLFGGAETASMAGGWAEYARTGFFQLVAVAAINLVLCVLSAKPDRLASRGGMVLRVANAVLLALTAVILVSAYYRMHLYIAAYGMSILRLMTLWGMLVILAGILLAAWKLYRPELAFYPLFFGFALTAWCLFCLAGPAGRAADYNVSACLDGRLEQVDLDYLRELGADAVPALERLAASDLPQAGEASRQLGQMRREFASQEKSLPWTQWSLSYRHYSR